MTAVIAQSILLSDLEDRTVKIDPAEANIDDVIKVANGMGYEVNYADEGDFYDVWGWYEGITENDKFEWRLSLYKPVDWKDS